MSVLTIYLPNISEDVWPFINTLSTRERQQEIEENACLSDRAVFIAPPDTVYLSPRPISPLYLEYVKSLTGIKPLKVLIPRVATGQLSIDVLNDGKIIRELTDIGKKRSRISLTSYSATPEFYRLASRLRQTLPSLKTPCAPNDEQQEVVNNYGSKAGIRRLIESVNYPDLKMAPGQIFTLKISAIEYAAELLQQTGGVVIKTNRGHAGMGLVIIPPGKIPTKDNRQIRKQIEELIKPKRYWEEFPIVVEEYIRVNHHVGGGFPNLEYLIDSSGKVNLLYCCGMSVSVSGVFQGVEIGPGCVPEPFLSKMLAAGQQVGKLIAAGGYRGYFDIDFVVGQNNLLYLTETNLRQTGGTHAYHLARQLLGKNFINHHYLIANNKFGLTKGSWSFEEVLNRLHPVIYSKQNQEGVIITSGNLISFGFLSFVVIGQSKPRALAIANQLKLLLGAK